MTHKVNYGMVIAGTVAMIIGLLGLVVAVESIGTVPYTVELCQCVNVEADQVYDQPCSSSKDPDVYQTICKHPTWGGPQPGAFFVGLGFLVFGIALTWMGLQGRGLGEGLPPSPDEKWGQERPNRDLDRF